MARIYESIEELIGKTPLLGLSAIEAKHGCVGHLYGKLESFNPGGSAKDRVALAMIEDAEKSGVLHPDSVIIEPTSGNTGIGLALVAAVRGYRTIIVMPDTMSEERRRLMTAYGAELVLTDGKGGMALSIKKAEELAREIPNSFIPSQFDNPANPMAHRVTTGPEIYEDLDGKVDAFVAGVGTGGTISGVGEYLKMKNPSVKIIAVEPSSSAVLSGEPAGVHGLQGIGAGFIPGALNTEIFDEVIKASEDEAYRASREAAKLSGVLVGISSGAALHAAIEVAKRPEYNGKNVVVLLPDTGTRYLTTSLFSE